MRSLLAQGLTPFVTPDDCNLRDGRTEATFAVRRNGRIYRFVVRDKVQPEDPYFVMVKAAAFAVRFREAYSGKSPARNLKDFLVKSKTII